MKHMSIAVRKAEIEDCRDLGRIHSESWKAAYKEIIPDSFLDKITAESRGKRFADAMSRGNERNFVAVRENGVVGFICLGKSRDDDLDDTFGRSRAYTHPYTGNRGIETHAVRPACLKDEGYERYLGPGQNERARDSMRSLVSGLTGQGRNLTLTVSSMK